MGACAGRRSKLDLAGGPLPRPGVALCPLRCALAWASAWSRARAPQPQRPLTRRGLSPCPRLISPLGRAARPARGSGAAEGVVGLAPLAVERPPRRDDGCCVCRARRARRRQQRRPLRREQERGAGAAAAGPPLCFPLLGTPLTRPCSCSPRQVGSSTSSGGCRRRGRSQGGLRCARARGLAAGSTVAPSARSNREAITRERLADARVFVLGGPRRKFTAAEFEAMKQFVAGGGAILVMLGEGGEALFDTNINFLLEECGIVVNPGESRVGLRGVPRDLGRG